MKGNHIKKIRVKVKEKPLQFFVTLGCFAFLALLIFLGMLTQSSRDRKFSREQKTVLLEETGALRSDMESEIKMLTDQLAQKKELVTETETILQELTKEYEASLDTYSMAQITATAEYLEKIRENIKNSEILIQTIQNSLENNQENTVSILESQMKELTDQFQAIEKTYSSSSDELKTLIEYLNKQNQDNTKDVLEQLKRVEDDLRKGNDTQLSETSKTIQNEVLNYITELSEQMTKQYDSINKSVDNQYYSLNTNLNAKYDSLDESLGDKYNSLDESLGDKYNSLDESLGNRYDSLDKNLGNRYDSLDESLRNRYDSLDESLGNKYDSLHTSISEQYADLSSSFSEKQNLMQTNMDTLFQDMTANNNQYFQQVLSDMGNGNQSLLTYMEQQFGQMQGKFDQVFQSVSSGKSILASALLTKGVEIPQDASFTQIKDGILAIPQTLYLGTETQYLPGTISYDYHHHTDANGNQTGGESYCDHEGGCFTSPVYHNHGSSCYETYTYTDYRYEPISWHWGSPHTHGNSYTGVPDNCRSCSYCGACEIYGGHSDHARRVEYTATGQRLICTKTPGSTIDKYTFGCGLGEGQIIGAHIVYQ